MESWSWEADRLATDKLQFTLPRQCEEQMRKDDKMALVKLDECEWAGWRLLMPLFFLPCNHLVQLFSLFVVSSSAFKDCPTFWPGTIHEIRQGGGSLFLFVSSIIRVISRKWRELKAKYRQYLVALGGWNCKQRWLVWSSLVWSP